MSRIYSVMLATWLATFSPSVLGLQVSEEVLQRDVGARVLAASSQSPVDFIDALRAEEIAAGLHVRADKWERLRFGSRPQQPTGSGKARLSQALAAFRLSHPGWSVGTSGIGVVIRDVGLTPRGDIISEFRAINMEVRSAFAEAERAVDPRIPVRGGVVGSILGNPEVVTPRPTPILITVDMIQASFEEILNAISAKVPGTGWVLVRHESNDTPFDTLSVRYPGNQYTESNYRLALPAKGR